MFLMACVAQFFLQANPRKEIQDLRNHFQPIQMLLCLLLLLLLIHRRRAVEKLKCNRPPFNAHQKQMPLTKSLKSKRKRKVKQYYLQIKIANRKNINLRHNQNH